MKHLDLELTSLLNVIVLLTGSPTELIIMKEKFVHKEICIIIGK